MHFADFHCDTISVLYNQNTDTETLLKNNLQVDAARLAKQRYILQHFAIFIDMERYENPYETALTMLDYYHDQLGLCSKQLLPVLELEDLERALNQQKTAAIATIEEGGILEGDIERLEVLHEKGVRLLTLTWNYENCIGSPNNLFYGKNIFPTEPNKNGGLTAFGREVVTRCEELGIIVDVSHLSDAGFFDVYNMCKKPFVASHSNSRAVCPHVRNMSDDMVKKLAEKGGLIGINFCPAFVESPFSDTPKPNPDMLWTPYGTIENTLRHIRHIYNVGGIQCLALGSDFDGIDRKLELDDIDCMPMLWEALKKDGFTENETDAILFQNMLRFYREQL